ncbi:hypothetical protein [Propionicimonas sp.]|uniref:hypothetical protein n=1 Tax=Propionicimonas sp. TaxID=1955623 RepID=UPI0039E6C1B5
MSFDPDTYPDGVGGRARVLAQALAGRADGNGELELTLYELRELASSDPEVADREIAALKAMRRLAMVTKPPQRGLRARWKLTGPAAVTATRKRQPQPTT